MPLSKPDRIPVTCPRCGHLQLEPRTGYSTICKECRQHFRLEEVRHRPAQPVRAPAERKQVRCFHCGAELSVPATATSTLCKRCGRHVDLADYRITQTVSKNFKTHGRLVIEEKGCVLDSEARVGEAIIKGGFTGELVAEGTLEINSSANIRGSLTAGRLVIPAGHHFHWPEPLRLGAADIGGELVGSLQAAGTVRLRATARLFGPVQARNFVIESGAVFVGTVRIGEQSSQETNENAAS